VECYEALLVAEFEDVFEAIEFDFFDDCCDFCIFYYYYYCIVCCYFCNYYYYCYYFYYYYFFVCVFPKLMPLLLLPQLLLLLLLLKCEEFKFIYYYCYDCCECDNPCFDTVSIFYMLCDEKLLGIYSCCSYYCCCCYCKGAAGSYPVDGMVCG